MPSPTSVEAEAIARHVFGVDVQSCVRFPTGLRHWVYDIELLDGTQAVVRLSDPRHRDELRGGVFWNEQLRSVDVRVPELIASDIDGGQPFMVLERLPGTDLGNIFDELSESQLGHIATRVAEFQHRASQLRTASGFGYALDYGTPLSSSWAAVLAASISRSERRIVDAGIIDPGWVDRVRRRQAQARDTFDDIPPTAFLHDATTKNLIISDGHVTGIVDTDEMGFGDPLWTVALTRMSLLSAGRPTGYIDRLLEAMGAPSAGRLDLYTAVFALDFLSELGQRFNRDEAQPVSGDEVERLLSVLTDLL